MINTLWNIPIENLEERYSSQWNYWFPNAFREAEIPFHTINADALCGEIRDGAFLDVCSTNFYKAGQLKAIVSSINDHHLNRSKMADHWFFFHDLWFPGIEMLAYMRNALNLEFKIAGCFHAGSYDPWDFLSEKGMESWAKYLETAWMTFVDVIFVATNFHKRMIEKERYVKPNKIHVTGFPIFQPPGAEDNPPRINTVIFPHRLNIEKNALAFDALEKIIFTSEPDWQFIKTMELFERDISPIKKRKERYYRTLQRSKIAVSFAKQETWGIAMQETVLQGCIPLVPDRLSYSEMYPSIFKYGKNDMDIVPRIKNVIKELTKNPYKNIFLDNLNLLQNEFLLRGEASIPMMIKIMQGHEWTSS